MEQEQEERIFARWLHYQHIPYTEFKGELIQNSIPVKQESQEEVLAKVKGILDNFTL